MFKILVFFSILFVNCVSLLAQPTGNNPLLIGRVAINSTQIVFTYAGRIWLVGRTGGEARSLNNGPHEETNPVFSPDGKQIAFSRSNGKDWDVYVVSSDGKSEARRLTFQPQDDFVVTWTPDGREIVFQSTRSEGGVWRFYKVAVENGALEEALPLPQAFDGSYSPDGLKIAYNPRDYRFHEWRYYRGGHTAPIWIADLKTGALEKLPNQNYNDRNPMWIGDKIYTVSDRTGFFNLFSYDRKTKQAKQLTKFDARGIRTAAATRDAICFVQNGRIHLFDLVTGQDKTVAVSVSSPDTSELSQRTVSAMNFWDSFSTSMNGDRLAIGARGEIILYDATTGGSKNLTASSGSAERYPIISPDNKSIAYFSDEIREQMLHVRSLATGVTKKISIEQKPSFYFNMVWSPDSKKLVFPDRRLNLWMVDVESGTTQKIDTSTYSAQENWQPDWSPDSRFLTYAKRLKNRAGTVFIFDSKEKRSFQITDGITHTESPVFDKNGKYLYFISSLNALTSEFRLGILNSQLSRPSIVRRVHALLLSKEIVSPVLQSGKSNAEAHATETTPSLKIDFENLDRRFIDLPVPERDYAQLIAGKSGRLFLVVNEWSETPGKFEDLSLLAVYLFNLASPEKGIEKIVDGFDSVEVTRDGNQILYQTGNDFFLTGADTAAKPGAGKLDLSKIEVQINPAEEWRQMFHESVRLMRDWFYDPNYHGQNLNELEKYYAEYLPTVTRRADLNRLMQQMLGSISVSHLIIGGGDIPPLAGNGNQTGLLGADYEIVNGHYVFKKIYRSTSFAAVNGSSYAPLDQPGIDVKEGDYLLEVNGQKLDMTKNLFSYFENTAGKPIKIVVSSDADGRANSRTIVIYPVSAENRLRMANWAENNRRLVEKMSGGQLGYIYIEGYLGTGAMNAIRGLAGYADKKGVIIDQRYNPGGYAPDYLIEWMRRTPLYYYLFRGGDDLPAPINPAPPVKIMLINERNGSAAETGAFMFKLGKLGSVVGKRTAGGGIGGYFFTPSLIDGGRVQIPNRAAYNPDGSSWGIENYGVTPDFVVEITPKDLLAGRDPQLEKAIEIGLEQIAKIKFQSPKHPAFPLHPLGNNERK